MKWRLSKRQLQQLYDLTSPPMTAFNCGALCAPHNNGVPPCCDQTAVVPVLYRDEFRWLKKKARFWKRMPVRTKHERKMVRKIDPNHLYCVCPGAAECRRSLRALVCRTFPFEPHLDTRGRLVGLTFQHEQRKHCPLIGRARGLFGNDYIKQSILFWRLVFAWIPEERELHIKESRKRIRRSRKTGRKFVLLTGERSHPSSP